MELPPNRRTEEDGEVGMKERVPKMCITCQHYEPYHCTVDDHYIGYLHCDELTKCRAYRLDEKYRRGGVWYDSRPEKKTV